MPKPNQSTPPKGSEPSNFTPSEPLGLDELFAGESVTPTNKEDVVPTPPAPQEPPVPPQDELNPSDDEPKDIRSFEPAEPEDRPTPAPKKPEQKPDRKAETSAIRQQLEKVNAEKKAAETELEKLRSQLSEKENTFKELENRYVESSKEVDAFRSREALGNPFQLPEVKAITGPYNQSINALSEEMQDLGVDTAGFNDWLTKTVQKYSELDPAGEGYAEEVAKIRSEAGQFGREFTPQVMKAVRIGADNRRKVIDIINTAQSDIPNHIYKQQFNIWQADATEFEQDERTIFNPPDDMKVNDPLNQSVILRAMIDGSEEVKKAAQTCLAFAKYATLPVKPVDPSAFEDPAKLQEAVVGNVKRHNDTFKKMRRLLPEAFLARAVLPSLWKVYNDALKELESTRKGNPKPKIDGVEHVEPNEQSRPIKDFNPVENPDLIAVQRKSY